MTDSIIIYAAVVQSIKSYSIKFISGRLHKVTGWFRIYAWGVSDFLISNNNLLHVYKQDVKPVDNE